MLQGAGTIPSLFLIPTFLANACYVLTRGVHNTFWQESLQTCGRVFV